MASSLVDKWCRRPESNRYGLWRDRGILSPLRLPVPPLRQVIKWRRHPDLNRDKVAVSAHHQRLNSQLQQKYDSISVTGRQAAFIDFIDKEGAPRAPWCLSNGAEDDSNRDLALASVLYH